MTTPTPPEVVPAQADREAAADLMEKLFTGVAGLESDLDWANTVRAGEDDEYPTVQAFARHRLATIEECAKVADRGYSAYEKRAKDGGYTRNERTRCSHYAQALSELATAIRQLSAPPPPPVDVGEGEDG